MVGLWCYNQSGVIELLLMRDPHYDRMCFKSVPFTAKNVELLELYPILSYQSFYSASDHSLISMQSVPRM